MLMFLHVGQGKAGFVQKSSALGKAVFADDVGRKTVKRITQWHNIPTLAVILYLFTQFVDRGRNDGLQSVDFLL